MSMQQVSMLRITCAWGLAAGLTVSTALSPQVWAQAPQIRGTYGSPRSFWERGARLDEYGVNAIFVHSGAINDELIQRAREEGARVFAEFATLNGKGYVADHPEAWPVNERGEHAPAATWFMGACPTEPGFRLYRMKQLRTLLRAYPLDGIWMDYLHWHAQFEDPNPVLPETCFNAPCLTAFQAATGIEVPAGTTADQAAWILRNRDRQWRDWRCAVIVGWARDIRRIIEQERPGALLGNFQCPWSDDDFDGARRRTLGLDLDQLAEVVDVFSPMVYHGRMGRPVHWVRENIAWFCERLAIRAGTGPRVWPIVQAHSDEGHGRVTAGDFTTVLHHGISAEADGVMMFTIHSVAQDDAKMTVLKRVYTGWARAEQQN